MKCKVCGKENKQGQKHCVHCGKPISGNHFKTIILISVIAIVAVIGIGAGLLLSMKNGEKNRDSTDISTKKYQREDVEAFFKENAEILAINGVNESKNVKSEQEVSKIFSERGFSDTLITAEYTMNGDFKEKTEIDDSAQTKHPMYQTSFHSSGDIYWVITVVDSTITANPVSYNLENYDKAELIVAETESITSYDSGTNKFYEVIPKESTAIIKIVDRIDRDTLDKITIGGIDSLWARQL